MKKSVQLVFVILFLIGNSFKNQKMENNTKTIECLERLKFGARNSGLRKIYLKYKIFKCKL